MADAATVVAAFLNRRRRTLDVAVSDVQAALDEAGVDLGRFLLDGLEVDSLAELHRLVDAARAAGGTTSHRGVEATVTVEDHPDHEGFVLIELVVEPTTRGLARLAYSRTQRAAE